MSRPKPAPERGFRMRRAPQIVSLRAFRHPSGGYDESHLVHLRKIGRTYYVDYLFEGRRVRRSLKTDEPGVAETRRAELEYKLRAKILQLPVDIRLEEFLKEYLDYIKGRIVHLIFRRSPAHFKRLAHSSLQRNSGVPERIVHDLT